MKNKKLKAILSVIGYFLLVIALCISASIVFHNVYYESVYVSGSSMSPTLTGSTMTDSGYGFDIEQEGSVVDFGIADSHKSALNNIKRFSVVSTYYSDDYDEAGNLIGEKRLKIKRVIALPGETFKIEQSKLYILNKENNEFEYVEYTFDINPVVSDGYTGKDIEAKELADDEYWVLGDHRDKSRDCGSLKQPIKKNYIFSVLIAIEGQAKLKLKECICEQCGAKYSKGVVCDKCSNKLTRVFDLVDKEYHWPKYF